MILLHFENLNQREGNETAQDDHCHVNWHKDLCSSHNIVNSSINPLKSVAIMGTAIKHHVPDRVKPSFVIFDIRAL